MSHRPSAVRASHPVVAALAVSFAAGCDAASGDSDGGGGAAPAALHAEAGFVEVPAAADRGPNFASRMFYSFHPSTSDDAPLVVLFNGGPGSATTSILAPYGTGPYRLDPEGAVDAPPIPNPDSYTRFANLLYIDERLAGFSYGRRPQEAPACIGGAPFYVQDASDFIFTLLSFLESHPSLAKRPVVLVGESYGGTRAPVMLHMLRHYAVAKDPPIPELIDIHVAVPWLRAKVQAHFDGQGDPGRERTPDEVTAQFGWLVMIQPNFFGNEQFTFQAMKISSDPDFAAFLGGAALDPYDVRKPDGYEGPIFDHAATAMRQPQMFEKLFGVAMSSVPGLRASDRGDAFRWFDGEPAATVASKEAELRSTLGELATDDAYWQPQQAVCHPTLGDVSTANAFASLLPHVHTFVTNGRYDSVVYTEALPSFFAERAGVPASVDTAAPAGAARPGILRLALTTGEVAVRFPTYESGHAVTLSAHKELGEDLEAWLGAEGALGQP